MSNPRSQPCPLTTVALLFVIVVVLPVGVMKVLHTGAMLLLWVFNR